MFEEISADRVRILLSVKIPFCSEGTHYKIDFNWRSTFYHESFLQRPFLITNERQDLESNNNLGLLHYQEFCSNATVTTYFKIFY